MTMPTPPPNEAPLSTTAKVAAVVEAHDARLAARSQLHPVAQVFDQLGDIVGMCVVGGMCVSGKLSGEIAALIVLAILGVQTGLRGGLARIGVPRAGALALVGLGLVHAAHVAAAGGGSPGYLRLPRWFRRGLRATQHVAVAGRAAWAMLRALLVAMCLALAGCPLPPPDGCTPRDTRCAPDGVPEVCSQSQRWTRGQPSEPCPERSTCCRARSPYGRELHACVPPSACLPENPAPSTPSALAGSQ